MLDLQSKRTSFTRAPARKAIRCRSRKRRRTSVPPSRRHTPRLTVDHCGQHRREESFPELRPRRSLGSTGHQIPRNREPGPPAIRHPLLNPKDAGLGDPVIVLNAAHVDDESLKCEDIEPEVAGPIIYSFGRMSI